jgi:hypothetical protein
VAKRPPKKPPRPAPRRMGLLAFWAIAVGMAALLTYLTGHVSVVTGDRTPDGRVAGTLRTSFLGLIPLSDTPLPGLRAARLEVVPDRKATLGPTYRVLLVTDGGEVPMTAASSGGRDRHQALADQISALAAGSGAFSVRHVAGGWFTLAPATGLVVLVGAACLAACGRTTEGRSR